MNQIKIKSGIPIPPVTRGGPPSKYPLKEMKVNDCFFLPKAKAKRVGTAIYNQARRVGIKVTVRQHIHEGVEGVMVWRLPDEP